jgi:hypothetical protein
MRRLLVTGLSIAGLSLSLALIGCGGGADEGVPADTKPGVSPEAAAKAKPQMVPIAKVPKTSAPSEATPETKP